MSTVIKIDLSDADVKRVYAAALADEARLLAKSVRKIRVGDPRGDITRGLVAYLEGRSETLRIEADKMDAR